MEFWYCILLDGKDWEHQVLAFQTFSHTDVHLFFYFPYPYFLHQGHLCSITPMASLCVFRCFFLTSFLFLSWIFPVSEFEISSDTHSAEKVSPHLLADSHFLSVTVTHVFIYWADSGPGTIQGAWVMHQWAKQTKIPTFVELTF